ncbi:MAG TPA: molecular chaperone DnaJ [Sneathiellales bacterium]|nr:molecular chaperone DnaJ [Sneathiellales bacterium]
MAKADYYDLLSVDRDATSDQLKSAYRKLAKQYHPDRNPGNADAEHRFKEISESYEVLKDPQKRAAYDQYGHAAFENGGVHPGGGFSSSFADVFDDLFGDFVGTRRGGERHTRGADLRYDMEVSLADAFSGKQASLVIPTSVVCDDCGGSGAKAGTRPTTCSTCSGHGSVRAQQGFFTVERTCPTCNGVGRAIKEPCPRCRGGGRIQKEKSLSVTIPRGVEDGTRIRLSGEGEAGLNGGQAGDLYIFLSISPHHLFQRDGINIYCRVPIPMTTATLGGQIDVPTVGGSRARVNIPVGTQNGRQFRLKGKGMPVLQGGERFGDMLIQAEVETPVNLSKRQKELLEDFQAEDGGTSPESEGFFTRVKDLWGDLKE